MVLSNSLGTALEMWDDQVPALTERFRVLRYDQRGHGAHGRAARAVRDRRPRPRRARAARRARPRAGGLLRLLARRHDGLWLAINAPERIDRLALCCTTAHLPPRDMWASARPRCASRGWSRSWRARSSAGSRPRSPSGDRRPWRTRAGCCRAVDPEGYAGCCEAIADHDLRDSLGRIEAPTVIVAGGRGPGHAARPGARDGGGHRRRAPRRAGRRAPPGEHRAAGRGEPRAARAPDRGGRA